MLPEHIARDEFPRDDRIRWRLDGRLRDGRRALPLEGVGLSVRDGQVATFLLHVCVWLCLGV